MVIAAPVVCGTPRGMLGASWQDRVDALGRGHYVRYDESTATGLGDGATAGAGPGPGRPAAEAAGGDVAELLRNVSPDPWRIGRIIAAALVILHFDHTRTT